MENYRNESVLWWSRRANMLKSYLASHFVLFPFSKDFPLVVRPFLCDFRVWLGKSPRHHWTNLTWRPDEYVALGNGAVGVCDRSFRCGQSPELACHSGPIVVQFAMSKPAFCSPGSSMEKFSVTLSAVYWWDGLRSPSYHSATLSCSGSTFSHRIPFGV